MSRHIINRIALIFITLRSVLIVALLIASLSFAVRVHAAGVVGTGTPASCTEAVLDAALAGGGVVTFNCGATPHTIILADYKSIAANTDIQGAVALR